MGAVGQTTDGGDGVPGCGGSPAPAVPRQRIRVVIAAAEPAPGPRRSPRPIAYEQFEMEIDGLGPGGYASQEAEVEGRAVEALNRVLLDLRKDRGDAD